VGVSETRCQASMAKGIMWFYGRKISIEDEIFTCKILESFANVNNFVYFSVTDHVGGSQEKSHNDN